MGYDEVLQIIKNGGATINKDGDAVNFGNGYQVSIKDCYIIEVKKVRAILRAVNELLRGIGVGVLDLFEITPFSNKRCQYDGILRVLDLFEITPVQIKIYPNRCVRQHTVIGEQTHLCGFFYKQINVLYQ